MSPGGLHWAGTHYQEGSILMHCQVIPFDNLESLAHRRSTWITLENRLSLNDTTIGPNGPNMPVHFCTKKLQMILCPCYSLLSNITIQLKLTSSDIICSAMPAAIKNLCAINFTLHATFFSKLVSCARLQLHLHLVIRVMFIISSALTVQL